MTDKKNGKIIGAVVWLVALAICIVATAFLSHEDVKRIHYGILIVLAILFGVGVAQRKEYLYRFSVALTVLLAVGKILYFLLTRSGTVNHFLSVSDGKELAILLLAQYGPNAFWMAMLTELLQVFFLPVPSSQVTMAAYYILDGNPWLTVLSCSAVLWIGSVLMFLVGKCVGKYLLPWIGGKRMRKKRKGLIGKDSVIFSYMFFMPFFPDDPLCFAAGMTTVSFRVFAIIQLISRPINVAYTVLTLEMGIDISSFFRTVSDQGLVLASICTVLFFVAFALVCIFSDKIYRFLAKLFRLKVRENIHEPLPLETVPKAIAALEEEAAKQEEALYKKTPQNSSAVQNIQKLLQEEEQKIRF